MQPLIFACKLYEFSVEILSMCKDSTILNSSTLNPVLSLNLFLNFYDAFRFTLVHFVSLQTKEKITSHNQLTESQTSQKPGS
jgi:hypothetical protein